MKVAPAYLLAEIVREARGIPVPEIVDRDTSPSHAWLLGYIAALQRVTEAFTKAEKPDA